MAALRRGVQAYSGEIGVDVCFAGIVQLSRTRASVLISTANKVNRG